MPSRALDLSAVAALALGAALAAIGLLFGVPELVPVGGALTTAACVLVAFRLWRWTQRVAAEARPLQEWEFRPGYLLALLAIALFMAAMFLDVGREDVAAWMMPGALALLVIWTGRARTNALLHELLLPTRTPRRR